MKKKRSYVPAILIGILGIAVTYFIDSSQNKQWQGKIREENNKTAEILRTEIKQLFCKKYLMMEIIVSELVSSPEKEKQIIEKYAEEMKPWELTLVKDFPSSEISSFLIAVRDNPSGKAMAVERVAGKVNSLYVAYPVGKSGQILLAESSPEDILLSSCSDFLPKYKLSLYATDLFGEKKKIVLTGNKNIQESFKITFPVLKHKHNLVLNLALKEGKGPVPPSRIKIWVSGLGITLLLVGFLTVLRKKNVALEKSKQVIEEDKRKLHELAIKDPLTNIFNRRHFEKLLHSEFRRAERYKSSLSCIMLDIDYFKNFNDTYGHQFGDVILKEVAALFKKLLREIDIIARYGGEEFVILLPETDEKGALGTAERLRIELEKKEYSFGGKAVKVTASFGVSAVLENSKLTQPEKLVSQADFSLYQAKEKGRNCVCYSELREEAMDKNGHLVNDLKKIEKGGVEEMKIAVVTTDKVNVSEHFGTAPYFFVVEVEGEKIANEEVRDKPCHKQLSAEEEHAQVDERGTHGFTAKASQRHKEMGEVVKDCEVVIAGRIGAGAYEDLKELGIKVIATDVKDIKEAVSLCAKGELPHKEERIH